MAKSLQVEDLTECPICQERFTQPKILSCQHTFCLNCLRGYVKDAPHFNCPTCRQRQKVPKAGLHVLKDSLVIKQLMDMTSPNCPDCCEDGRILKQCDHCEEKLCAACRKQHMKLAEGILAQFLSTMGKVRPRMDMPAFEPTLEEERELRSSVLSEFDEVTNTLTERKAQLLAQVDGVMGFRRLLSMTREDARSNFQVKIKSYRSVGQLMSLKEFLTQLDSDRPFLKTLAKGSCPILKLDASGLRFLGGLYCEDIVFSAPNDQPAPMVETESLESVETFDKGSQTVDESSTVKPGLDVDQARVDASSSAPKTVEKRPLFPFNILKRLKFSTLQNSYKCRTDDSSSSVYADVPGGEQRSTDSSRADMGIAHSSSTTGEQRDIRPLSPSNVDYKSKRSLSTRQLINKHPDDQVSSRRVIRPTCAIYCDQENAIYCISEGEILCYDLQTLNGRRIGHFTDAKYLTVMKSGKVLFTDGEAVMCVENGYISGTSVRTILSGFNNLTQLCCVDMYIFILHTTGARSRGCLTSFTEEGNCVCKYSLCERLENVGKMFVDMEGCIYVDGIGIHRVTRDVLASEIHQCQYREWLRGKSMCVEVAWELVISRLTPSWYGHNEQLTIVDQGRENYYYGYSTGVRFHPGYRYYDDILYYTPYNTNVPSDDQIIKEKAVGGLCVDADGYISVTRPGKNQIDVYIQTKRPRRNELFHSFPVQFVRAWPKVSFVLFSSLFLLPCLLFGQGVHIFLRDGLPRQWFLLIGESFQSLIDFEEYVPLFLVGTFLAFLAFLSLIPILIDHHSKNKRARDEKRLTGLTIIQGFDEPSSVSLTPDGKMIVCDNNGINIV